MPVFDYELRLLSFSLLSTLILTGIGFNSFGQFAECCPLLGPLEVFPNYPSEEDSTFIITDVMTTNSSFHLGTEVVDSGDTIFV